MIRSIRLTTEVVYEDGIQEGDLGVWVVQGNRRETHRELRSQRTKKTEKKKGNKGRDRPAQPVEAGAGCPQADQVEFR